MGNRKTEARQRQLCGIYFIDPADEEFKEIVKNARRKLEVLVPAAMQEKERNVQGNMSQSRCKSSGAQRMGKTSKDIGRAADESQNQKRGDR